MIKILTSILLTQVIVKADVKVLLTLDEPFEKDQNVLWSPIIQASWDNLNTLFPRDSVKTTPPNPIITYLDEFKWNEKKVMPELFKMSQTRFYSLPESTPAEKIVHNGYKVYAGPNTIDFTKSVVDDVKKTFDVDFPEFLAPENTPLNTFCFLGILKRDLKFIDTFTISDKQIKFDSGKIVLDVKSFGAEITSDTSHDVKVLKYSEQKKEHMIRIDTSVLEESVILFQPEKKLSFKQAINSVNNAIAKPLTGRKGAVDDPSLHKEDQVKIPFVQFKGENNISAKLNGITTFDKTSLQRRIDQAKVKFTFDMDQDGVSATVIGFGRGFGGQVKDSTKPKYIPRKFIFNRPFYVFMWKKDALLPYFSTYIGNAQVMTHIKEE